MLGGSDPDIHVVQGVKTPQRKLKNSFCQKIDNLLNLDRRSLLLVHYAGHGTVVNGELMFTAGGHQYKAISWPDLVQCITNRKTMENNDPLDVLFILDSCSSGMATRKPNATTERIVDPRSTFSTTFNNALGNTHKSYDVLVKPADINDYKALIFLLQGLMKLLALLPVIQQEIFDF